MFKQDADRIAQSFGGESLNSGGGVHLAIIPLPDGHILVVSDEVTAGYNSLDDFDNGYDPVGEVVVY